LPRPPDLRPMVDCYIVAGSPTGVDGQATKLAFYLNTAWGVHYSNRGNAGLPSRREHHLRYSGAAWASSASYTAGGTDVALADGGTGASLADPNNDRIMFWDDSAGAVTWLAPRPIAEHHRDHLGFRSHRERRGRDPYNGGDFLQFCRWRRHRNECRHRCNSPPSPAVLRSQRKTRAQPSPPR
jgi:hypothetical protein